MRTKAAIRSKDAARAIAGAIVAGLIYDVVKAGANRLWITWKQRDRDAERATSSGLEEGVNPPS
jgi:hypothetical protein